MGKIIEMITKIKGIDYRSKNPFTNDNSKGLKTKIINKFLKNVTITIGILRHLIFNLRQRTSNTIHLFPQEYLQIFKLSVMSYFCFFSEKCRYPLP